MCMKGNVGKEESKDDCWKGVTGMSIPYWYVGGFTTLRGEQRIPARCGPGLRGSRRTVEVYKWASS